MRIYRRLLRISVKLMLLAGIVVSVLASYLANAWHQRRAELAYISQASEVLKSPFQTVDLSKGPAGQTRKVGTNGLF